MLLSRAAPLTLVLAGLAPVAWAQAVPGGSEGGPTEAGSRTPDAAQAGAAGDIRTGLDVTRLPIDLSRIQRGLRSAAVRESRDGLKLEFIVEVFAKAPPINIFYREDNLAYGLAPYGGPTHREMLNVMTPKEFRAPVADFSALVRQSKSRR
jgi:hypothetical protein